MPVDRRAYCSKLQSSRGFTPSWRAKAAVPVVSAPAVDSNGEQALLVLARKCLHGTWIGTNTGSSCTSYTITQSGRSSWKGTCMRASPQSTKQFSLFFEPSDGLVWWSPMKNYFLDPKEVDKKPDQITWYAAEDSVKRRRKPGWQPRAQRHPRFTWARNAASPEGEARVATTTEPHSGGLMEEDSGGEVSARDKASIASVSTCMLTTLDAGGDDSASGSASDVRRDAASDAAVEVPPAAEAFAADAAQGLASSDAGAGGASAAATAAPPSAAVGDPAEASCCVQNVDAGNALVCSRCSSPVSVPPVLQQHTVAAQTLQPPTLPPPPPPGVAPEWGDDARHLTGEADASRPMPPGQVALAAQAAKALARLPHAAAPASPAPAPARAAGWPRQVPVHVMGVCPQGLPLSPASRHSQGILDYQIVAAFTATVNRHEQLAAAAWTVIEELLSAGTPRQQLVLYGSLSLVRAPFWFEHDGRGGQGVATSYATNISDVDVALLLREGTTAACVITLLQVGNPPEWRRLQSRLVPRFAVAQWTLVNRAGVHLDLTCINDAVHFEQFKERQVAFRRVFWQMRMLMQVKYSMEGAMAFDAYIYLLKAFAAFVSRSALTSFQATCLGLFVLQQGEVERHAHRAAAPAALSLFGRFLVWCRMFFADGVRRKSGRHHQGYRVCAIDLSGEGGRLIERQNLRANAELYFANVELHLGAAPSEWLNVLHSSDPKAISAKARLAYEHWFVESSPWKVWGRMRQDLSAAMRPAPLKLS
uniref:Uncharacterized protein n=1 Tax=Alexandrium monilatum TaxID=311494 RepID=A0A7S4VUM8_9DINO